MTSCHEVKGTVDGPEIIRQPGAADKGRFPHRPATVFYDYETKHNASFSVATDCRSVIEFLPRKVFAGLFCSAP